MDKKIGRPKSKEAKILIPGFFLPASVVGKLDRLCKKRGQSRRDIFRLAVERAAE